jgi:hypothetical protein
MESNHLQGQFFDVSGPVFNQLFGFPLSLHRRDSPPHTNIGKVPRIPGVGTFRLGMSIYDILDELKQHRQK